MRDSRLDALARVLVHYSTKVRSGDVVSIEGGSPLAQPLMLAVYEQVLSAGGLPVTTLIMDGQNEAFFRLAGDKQLDWVSPTQRFPNEQADVRISISATANTRELSAVDPAQQARRGLAMRPLMQRMMERSAAGELRWVGTLIPTEAYAAEADMSLRQYEDMFFEACLVDSADPVAAWQTAADETARLSEWIQGRKEVRITGPGTDLTLSIDGRTFVPGTGTHNMPDGEFFTGPVEDSANGEITFHLPAVHAGRDVTGVHFRFENGKVVDASADRNEDYLISLLDSDPGARFLGELGIGTNFGIQRGTRSILLDEKIGGTIHLAVGQSYPETGGRNESSVHWDMICDLRHGGRIEVDGELFQENGVFVV